jgi:hypothetical protein
MHTVKHSDACVFVSFSLVLEKPLEGMHIVVDAGNGAGGFFVVMCFIVILQQCILSSLSYLLCLLSLSSVNVLHLLCNFLG